MFNIPCNCCEVQPPLYGAQIKRALWWVFRFGGANFTSDGDNVDGGEVSATVGEAFGNLGVFAYDENLQYLAPHSYSIANARGLYYGDQACPGDPTFTPASTCDVGVGEYETMIVFDLRHEGQNYSLKTLYGITGLTLDIVGWQYENTGLSAPGYKVSCTPPLVLTNDTQYSNNWANLIFKWGTLSLEQMELWFEYLRPRSSLITGGAKALTPYPLGTWSHPLSGYSETFTSATGGSTSGTTAPPIDNTITVDLTPAVEAQADFLVGSAYPNNGISGAGAPSAVNQQRAMIYTGPRGRNSYQASYNLNPTYG